MRRFSAALRSCMALVVVTAFSAPAFADRCPPGTPPTCGASPHSNQMMTSTAAPAPEPTDTRFVTEVQGGSTATIQIKRHIVGADPSTGTIPVSLKPTLMQSGLVGDYATLSYSANVTGRFWCNYDKRKTATLDPRLIPDIHLNLNGESLDVFKKSVTIGLSRPAPSGAPGDIFFNNVVVTYTIPIELVRFGKRSDPDAAEPIPSDNEVRFEVDCGGPFIDHDPADPGECFYCGTVLQSWDLAWVALDVQALAPLVLVHGVNVDEGIWAQHCVPTLFAINYVPYKAVRLGSTDTIEKNANLFAQELQNVARYFGAKAVHIVAHSKGGLDTRRFLNLYYDHTEGSFGNVFGSPNRNFPDRITVLSFHMLATPNHGSILADISVQRRDKGTKRYFDEQGVDQTADPSISKYLDGDDFVEFNFFFLFKVEYAGPRGKALRDLQTSRLAQFDKDHQGVVPAAIPVHTYSGDADVDNSFSPSNLDVAAITSPEAKDQFDSVWNITIPFVGNIRELTEAKSGDAQYKTLRRFSRVEDPENVFGRKVPRTVVLIANVPLQDNDLLVAKNSSLYDVGPGIPHGPYDKNHSHMRDQDMFRLVLKIITGLPYWDTVTNYPCPPDSKEE
jgi:hypothetical protein